MDLEPLRLDPNYMPDATELAASLAVIYARMRAMEDEIEKAKQTMPAPIEKPWAVAARKTERQFDSSAIWADVSKSRRALAAAMKDIHVNAATTGNWEQYHDHQLRLWRVRLAISRLYLAAILHRCHIVGVMNHESDLRVIDAFCPLKTSGALSIPD